MNELEQTIVSALLDGPGEELEILRAQAARSTVRNREHTGVGFYTTFDVPLEVPRLPSTQGFRLGDIAGEVEGVEHGMLFILWGERGQLDCLEGATYADALPANPRLLSWRYLVADEQGKGGLLESESRDMPSVLRSLAG